MQLKLNLVYKTRELHENKYNLGKNEIAKIKLGKERMKLNKGKIIYNKTRVPNDKSQMENYK